MENFFHLLHYLFICLFCLDVLSFAIFDIIVLLVDFCLLNVDFSSLYANNQLIVFGRQFLPNVGVVVDCLYKIPLLWPLIRTIDPRVADGCLHIAQQVL